MYNEYNEQTTCLKFIDWNLVYLYQRISCIYQQIQWFLWIYQGNKEYINEDIEDVNDCNEYIHQWNEYIYFFDAFMNKYSEDCNEYIEYNENFIVFS